MPSAQDADAVTPFGPKARLFACLDVYEVFSRGASDSGIEFIPAKQILSAIEGGDAQAAERLLPLVYGELRKLAAARMAQESPDHTLQATALVHEAYLRLVGSNNGGNWDGRGHFFAAAAEAMRRILVDHARNNHRLKRGGEAQPLSLDAVDFIWKPQYGDMLDLHEALSNLESVDPQSAELVKLRCFAGQTQAEAAALLGVSRSTADRSWAFARATEFRRTYPVDGMKTSD